MDTVFVHADESCLGNQFKARANPGGAAGLVETWKDRRWERRDFWIAEPDTTNNRMALRSAIEALASLRRPCRVHFVSDSQYLVKGIAEWLPAWRRAGWKRKTGAIKNLELWKRLDGELARHQVTTEWVRGHAGHPENEYVDFLATRAAQQQAGSGGLVASGFEAWLAEARDRDRWVGYIEHAPPKERFGRG